MRIFVSVGTHTQQFDRLFKELEAIKQRHPEWEIYAQTGYSQYKPMNCHLSDFLNEKQYGEWFSKADVVVSHGGAGTIIGTITRKKPLVIAPRLAKFGEHTNDHQLELAKAIEERGLASIAVDISSLEEKIMQAYNSIGNFESGKNKMAEELREYLLALKK